MTWFHQAVLVETARLGTTGGFIVAKSKDSRNEPSAECSVSHVMLNRLWHRNTED